MLSSTQAAVRVRAFDLVLNLGVHAHLLEPTQSEDQSCAEEPSQPSALTGGSFSSVLSAGDLAGGEKERTYQENGGVKGVEKPDKGTPAAVGIFEAWLLDIVCEMLLYLVQVGDFLLYSLGFVLILCISLLSLNCLSVWTVITEMLLGVSGIPNFCGAVS